MKNLSLALIVAALAFVFGAVSFAATPVTVAWTYSSADIATYGVTTFTVERKAEACAGSGAFVQITTVAANLRSFSDTQTTAGATYCYRVSASGTAGTSAYSNLAEKTVLGPPPAPTGLTAS